MRRIVYYCCQVKVGALLWDDEPQSSCHHDSDVKEIRIIYELLLDDVVKTNSTNEKTEKKACTRQNIIQKRDYKVSPSFHFRNVQFLFLKPV